MPAPRRAGDRHGQVDVPLPLVPAFLASAVPLSVPVTSTSVAVVDRFGPR